MSFEKKILEQKAKLREENLKIAKQAEEIAKSLHRLANRIEKAAISGGETVDSLWLTPDFRRDHLFEGVVGVPYCRLTEHFEEADFIIECIGDYQSQDEEERAAAAIHAGLKNEDGEPANPSSQVFVHLKDWKPSPESQKILDSMDD